MSLLVVTLFGRAHPSLGETVVTAVGERAAIGLSAGRYPKGYPATEPNEDAVLGATDGASWLLAVADGHSGADASHAVIEALADHAGALLGAEPVRAGDVVASLAVDAAAGGSSGTTLAVLLAGPGGAVTVTAGDSPILDVSKRPRWLTHPAPFLHVSSPRITVLRRAPTRVVVATDGVTDFLGRSPERTMAGAMGATAEESVANILGLAHDGGAGDNTAVVVFQ